jgi:dTDP-4-dehydrorhamnose 3,5-epimerase
VKIAQTPVSGVYLVTGSQIADERGAFSRLFCADELHTIIGSKTIVQINQSTTRKVGAVRGLHYQNAPHAETKIVRCLRGRVFDVAVDLRRGSPTFLQFYSYELAPEDNTALVIPEGCAHGFQVLEPDSQLLYLHSNYYAPHAEGGVRFDDPKIRIQWPLPPTDLSQRDLGHRPLEVSFKGLAV